MARERVRRVPLESNHYKTMSDHTHRPFRGVRALQRDSTPIQLYCQGMTVAETLHLQLDVDPEESDDGGWLELSGD